MAVSVPLLELEDANGNIYPLEWPGRHVLEMAGLGMPPVRHWTTRAPFQHGQSHWGFSLQPRIINLTMFARGGCNQGLWDRRRENISMINPLIGAMILRLTYPNSQRTFELHDVWYSSGFSFSSQQETPDFTLRDGLQLIAFDPLWKEEQGSYVLDSNNYTSSPQLVLPFVGPFVLGATVWTYTIPALSVVVGGNWESYPVLIVTGPTEDWTLTNDTNGKEITWNGYSIAAGEVVTFNIPNKTVTNAAGDNLITYAGGNFGTFTLDPGDNQISLEAIDGIVAGVSEFELTWYDQWLGL